MDRGDHTEAAETGKMLRFKKLYRMQDIDPPTHTHTQQQSNLESGSFPADDGLSLSSHQALPSSIPPRPAVCVCVCLFIP